MEKFSDWLSYQLFLKGHIQQSEVYSISFAIQVILSNIASFFTIFLLGIWMKIILEMSLFFLVFIGFRTLNDRYHAKTFLRCFILTVGSFLFSVLVSHLIVSKYALQFVLIIAFFNIFFAFFSSKFITEISKTFLLLMFIFNISVAILSLNDTQTIHIFLVTLTLIIVVTTSFAKLY